MLYKGYWVWKKNWPKFILLLYKKQTSLQLVHLCSKKITEEVEIGEAINLAQSKFVRGPGPTLTPLNVYWLWLVISRIVLRGLIEIFFYTCIIFVKKISSLSEFCSSSAAVTGQMWVGLTTPPPWARPFSGRPFYCLMDGTQHFTWLFIHARNLDAPY